MKKIWLSPPHMGGHEKKFVNEAFETNWIAPLGPNVDGFERDMEDFLGGGHAAALSSGTAAIHLALVLLNTGPGDVVICQSFTFSGSANPIAYVGAEPFFVDSEELTWNMDPDLLKKAVAGCMEKGRKPKAIIPVHLYGMPAQMDRIKAVAQVYDIPVIEDAAEALGSRFEGKACGTLGDMSIFSFNGNKIITTSGGGALISQNEKWIKKARFFATQAQDAAPHYQHSQIGYNYRMSNVIAGIGRGQMEVLNERVEKKREINRFYHQLFDGREGVTFLTEPDSRFHSNFWLTTILIDPEKAGFTREDLRRAFAVARIDSRPLWKPMHMQPVFKDAPAAVNGVSEKLFENGLCLPSGTNMGEEELGRIGEVVEKF